MGLNSVEQGGGKSPRLEEQHDACGSEESLDPGDLVDPEAVHERDAAGLQVRDQDVDDAS